MLRRCASLGALGVFVGFSFDKSFNIFVGEGVRHESFTCRIFGCFFWCIARGHRNLLVGKPLSKVARKKARDVTKADWHRIFTCKIIVILHVPITILFSGGNLYKTLQLL